MNRYIPILKWKLAEQEALRSLGKAEREMITPMLEIVDDEPDPVVLGKRMDKLLESWGTSRPVFVDPGELGEEITDEGQTGAETVFAAADARNIRFIPVMDLTSSAEVADAVRRYAAHGVAIRLSPDDVETEDLSKRLQARLRVLGVAPEQVDLVLDLGSVEGESPGSVIVKTEGFVRHLPSAFPWRTMVLAATSFPYSMAGFQRNAISRVYRTEWLAWRAAAIRLANAGDRVPVFSDYGIQHPKLIEFDPRIMRMSASVRYALETEWLIAKGENLSGGRGFDQIYDVAKMLCEHPRFKGEAHCAGCAELRRLSRGEGKTGNATFWRWIGTVHHLTVTVNQAAGVLVP